MAHPMHEDPAAYWNDEAGPKWVATHAMFDRLMIPVTVSILESAALAHGERVVDIGSGAGSLAFAAAETVGATGHVTGLDISRPLVEHARSRVPSPEIEATVDFQLGDAQTHEFPNPVDVMLSRFGVMFFRDPAAAFGNIAGALAPGGRCAFAVWQGAKKNPWITWTIGPIADLLPQNPDGSDGFGEDDLPGPFRYADEPRFRGLLEGAGLTDVAITGFDRPICIAGSEDDIFEFVQQVGPLSRAVSALDAEAAATALARVRARIDEVHDGVGITLPASWWIATARAPG